jgi:hypothetical protein
MVSLAVTKISEATHCVCTCSTTSAFALRNTAQKKFTSHQNKIVRKKHPNHLNIYPCHKVLSPPQKGADKLAVCLTVVRSAEHSFMQRMNKAYRRRSFVAVSRLRERSYGVPKQHDAGERTFLLRWCTDLLVCCASKTPLFIAGVLQLEVQWRLAGHCATWSSLRDLRSMYSTERRSEMTQPRSQRDPRVRRLPHRTTMQVLQIL